MCSPKHTLRHWGSILRENVRPINSNLVVILEFHPPGSHQPSAVNSKGAGITTLAFHLTGGMWGERAAMHRVHLSCRHSPERKRDTASFVQGGL